MKQPRSQYVQVREKEVSCGVKKHTCDTCGRELRGSHVPNMWCGELGEWACTAASKPVRFYRGCSECAGGDDFVAAIGLFAQGCASLSPGAAGELLPTGPPH